MLRTEQTENIRVEALAPTVSVSGRYDGEMSFPQPGRFALDLRIDVDRAVDNSAVTNRVSGDFYQVTQTVLPGQPARISKTYLESWIIDDPNVTRSIDHIDIEGSVRFWTGVHPATTAAIEIVWHDLQATPTGTIKFTETGSEHRIFTCRRSSESFRSVTLEIAVCSSVNAEPLRPSYDTRWHDNRPTNTIARALTIETSYREAGVDLSINPNVTIVDDSNPQFKSWSIAELHDALESHFSLFGQPWPNWALWGLMAGAYEDSAVGGIMFDAAAASGGQGGNEPERRGFAVFRGHAWFDGLIVGPPGNQLQAAAIRQFLYTWVHEAGHAFNLLHSWDKARPDSLSWMNYDWRYDQRNGQDLFWKRFSFRFDDDELIHIRHGDRASVIMGGDPWSSGSHLESPNLSMARIEGDAPIELTIRAQPYFDLMEPVLLEVRLRNLLTDASVIIDTRFAPEYGGIIVHIQGPDGQIEKYEPVVCAVGDPQPQKLAPSGLDQQGEDRFSRDIFISYGASGFHFDRPGEYRIRAIYQGHGDLLITSNTLRIRVGVPLSKEADRLAQDYFSDPVGLTLYLQGSRSPHLKKGFDVLQDVADRYKASLLGANTAIALAQGISRPFHRVEYERAGGGSPKITLAASAEPNQALKMTSEPLKLMRESDDKLLNLAYARVVRRRAVYHEETGTVGQAKNELATLQRDLTSRGANPPVIQMYAKLQAGLGGKPSTKPSSSVSAKQARGGGGASARPRRP